MFNKEKFFLLENFMSLLILQGANYILPLITLPYLVRVLGSQNYGIVLFAQSFIAYFAILINFGFDIYGIKEISSNYNNSKKVSKIVFSILFSKLILFFVSFLLIFIFALSINKLYVQKDIIFLTSLTLILNVFSLNFFFQGIEKMKFISILTLTNKLIFTISIFIFIKNSSDYIKVPIFYTISAVISSIAGIYIALKFFHLKVYIPTFQDIKTYLKNSFQFFSSRVFTSIYTNTNSFIIGIFLDYHYVTIYEIAYKLFFVFRTPFDILNNVFYPYISRTKNIKFLKKVIFFSFSTSIFMYLVLYIMSPYIISILFGEKYIESASVLRILLISIIFISIHLFLGTSSLVAFGYSKYFNLSVIYSTIFYIILLSFLLITEKLTVITISFSMVLVVFFILLYRLYYVKKFNII